MRHWIFLSFSTALLLSTAIAQERHKGLTETVRITGQVTEATSGKPIIDANVLLRGTMMGAATDSRGRFTLSYVPPSTYTVRVSAIGYKSEEKTIRVLSDVEIDLRFSLQETVLLMDGIAVTASRYQQSLEDIPVSLNLVPSQEISERNITSLDHALRYVPGVNALEGGQITIRGSSGFNFGMGSRVLVLLNGNPFMTGDNWDVSWYSIPFSNIKQIEVMKGSGSALYGSSAMGGVINIITDEPGEGSHINVRTYTGFYGRPSYPEWRWRDKTNHFEGTAVDLSTHLGPVSTFLSSNYQATTGYRENDDHRIFNFMATLGYRFNANLRFDLMTGYGRKKGGFFIYWQDLQNPYNNGSDSEDSHTRSTLKNTYAFPSISYILSNRIFLSLRGRFRNTKTEDHWQAKTEGAPEEAEAFRMSSVKTQGGEVQLNYQINAQGIVVAGCDLQKDKVESIQYDTCQVSKGSYYIQCEQRFWGKLKATIGVRYDWEDAQEIRQGYSQESTLQHVQIDPTGELSRKLGLNLSPMQGTNIRFSMGEGFRTPAVVERFVDTYTSGLRVAPNPDLKPEKSTSVEIGIKQALTKSMNVDLAVFYNKYTNLIEPSLASTGPGESPIVQFDNVSKARVQGLDLSYRTDWWSNLASTRLGYTFLDTKGLSSGEGYGAPLKYRSKHTLYFANDITFNLLSFGIDLRYLSKIERVDEYHKVYIKDIEELVPTYVVALRFGVSWEHFSVRLLVDNLFQYNYLTAPANIGPPRTGVFQVNMNY